MAYFYAQKMTYCECMMPREIAWEVMNRLGSQQLVHFETNMINYENPFTRSLKRCDQALNKIAQIKAFLKQIHKDFKLVEPKSYKQAIRQFDNEIMSRNIHGHLFMNEVEQQIINSHGYLIRQKKQMDSLKKTLSDFMTSAALLITVSRSDHLKDLRQEREMEEFGSFGRNPNVFDYKCVIVNRVDQMQVVRGLFRISRGNIWVQVVEIPMESVQQLFKKSYQFLENKIVCILIYQKGEENFLASKINRFLSCLESTILEGSPSTWSKDLKQIQERAKQVMNLQQLTIDAVERYLHKLHEQRLNSSMSNLAYLQTYARKQREIYRALSYTTVSSNFLHFNIYIPSKSLPLHIQPNQQLPPLILNVREPPHMPPSKFDSPPLLQVPQAIVNTYGIPSYGQFNPSVFYIVTFGFFIGVMFGDVGHMLMAIPLLIIFDANIWFWTVIFWMGYCGVIYNEFFGLNLGLLTSCYSINQTTNTALRTTDCVYAFGIDSIWKIAENQMQFVNSLKMKLSVIIGVTHMMLGLFVRFINGIKRRDKLDIITLTIPQVIFMVTTFVYMDFLIVYKWNQVYTNTAQAPSIIATMIAVYAGFSSPDDKIFWNGERDFEKILVGFAFSMIPIMLLAKPITIYCTRKNKQPGILAPNEFVEEEKFSDNHLEQKAQSNYNFGISNPPSKKLHEEEEPLNQIFVHQFIQTIEFVLGSVSNTASYLRLWALSLAHGQLSEVIFDLILKGSLKGGYSSIFLLFLVFPFYFAVTFGVLIGMDSLECFLHSLRLHWVEFQNKFYQGRGYQFTPYTFKPSMERAEQ